MTGAHGPEPSLSVVVVVHDMVRELPRTLASLDPDHQRGISAGSYEVIVVDNGSAVALDDAMLQRFRGELRVERLSPAPPSPARAANHGIGLARGSLIGLIIDGARMASPGLLSTASLAARLAPRPVITTPAWHLGAVSHMRAGEVGYDRSVEDALLAGSGWEDDGYALFEISTLAESSWRGWFGPMGESSSLFLTREVWSELDGLDERFSLPGGGLVNHDLYRRACSLPGVQLVELLGEGTFHQFHGGASTSRRFTWEEMHAEYETHKGRPYRRPGNAPLFVGRAPRQVLPHIERSARLAIERLAVQSTG